MGKYTAKKIGLIGLLLTVLSFILIVISAIYMADNTDNEGAFSTAYNIAIFCSLFLWIGIILLIVAGIVYFIERKKLNEPKEHANKILYERFAKGEITKEEFEQLFISYLSLIQASLFQNQ